MDVYRRLGVTPVINCATAFTLIGGSIMEPQVARAMADAAAAFVNINDLQAAVGRRLAELTHNEAAYVSNGAAAGLAIATAACIAGEDPALVARLPSDLDGMKNEVVVHRSQRNWYDIGIRMTGARLVEIGHTLQTQDWELDAAINERTAAVFYFAGPHLNRNTLPLPFVIERAHARGVSVIVDAAAQVPPVSNLWHFTRDLGADLAVYSGGKALRGPQNSGLCVGSADLVRKMQFVGPPNQRFGRALKVAKETMIGLLAAVETFVNRDHAADARRWSDMVDSWLTTWRQAVPGGVEMTREETLQEGVPIPRVVFRFEDEAAWNQDAWVNRLRAGDPPIEVVRNGSNGIAFTPYLLQDGEADVVTSRVRELLELAAAPARTTAGVAGA
jgi:L-seryl-tRNA(Ser) seleniumtransferase